MNDAEPFDSLPQAPVEVFRSHWRPACDERAFVLHAVGIGSQVVSDGAYWSIVVSPASAKDALVHLRRYERENPPRRRFLRPAVLQPYAWAGAACYCAVLLLVAYLAGQKSFATDWLDVGVLNTAALRGGELWRAATAVTLHFDVAHLLGNLGFGAFFGWLAAQMLGPGVAFGGAFAAATLANLLNGAVQPERHVSAGASTMVFALLGLLAAYAWRHRADAGERWAYRWAPLIAGVFLLAFTGAGGERTDVLAHLTGFITGALAGWLLALRPRPPGAMAQWLAGLATIAAIVAAWSLALSTGT
jgi:rhomboid protease GluP